MNERTIVVGDVHGCLEELDELLALAEYRQSDRLVFLGDLVDRGPDPVGCVRRARELGALAVLGNHEEKALRWRRYERRRSETGQPNPMHKPTPERRAQWEALSNDDLIWIASLPSYLDLGDDWLAVHAGFEPGFPMDQQRMDRVIRVRWVGASGEMVASENRSLEQPKDTVYWTKMWKGPKSVVYGHAVHSHGDPRVDYCYNIREHNAKRVVCVGIDTGCVFGGHLSAFILLAGRNDYTHTVQVRAKREYYPPLSC